MGAVSRDVMHDGLLGPARPGEAERLGCSAARPDVHLVTICADVRGDLALVVHRMTHRATEGPLRARSVHAMPA